MTSQTQKAEQFVRLHEAAECFLIPNPWDAGSARLLEWVGMRALATTGAGLAFSHAQPDLSLTREQKMTHLREICSATRLL
jgi:2-methylisocitrate lyase-like PEP mutase family enzyme